MTAVYGNHRDAELRDMAGNDEPPTVDDWNQVVHNHDADWATLATS